MGWAVSAWKNGRLKLQLQPAVTWDDLAGKAKLTFGLFLF